MATPKQTDPQFKLRLTNELRDQIETSAKNNNRSMNAEIIARLESYDSLNARVDSLSEDKIRLLGEQSALSDELLAARLELNSQRDSSHSESILQLLKQVREHQQEDSLALNEVREIVKYLRGDALCINAELSNDVLKPSAIRPNLETSVGRDLAEAIDQRSWALAKAIKQSAQGAREHEIPAMMAKQLRHQILGDTETDDLLIAFLNEVDGLATPLHAADFYDKVSEKFRHSPEEIRLAHQAALDAIMPKLFKGWPDDWY